MTQKDIWRKTLSLPVGVGVDRRIERAIKIVDDSTITSYPQDGWTLVNVESQSDPEKRYVVGVSKDGSTTICNCPDWKKPHTAKDGGRPIASSYNCKHVIAVRMKLSQEDTHEAHSQPKEKPAGDIPRAELPPRHTSGMPDSDSINDNTTRSRSVVDTPVAPERPKITIPQAAQGEVDKALLEYEANHKPYLPAAANNSSKPADRYTNHLKHARSKNGVIYIEA